MPVIGLLLCMAGFAGLALATSRHHRDVFGTPPGAARRKALRLAGWGLLALSLWPCLASWGPLGLVAWAGLLSLGAITVVLALTYRRRASIG
jgi:hypothetical protein